MVEVTNRYEVNVIQNKSLYQSKEFMRRHSQLPKCVTKRLFFVNLKQNFNMLKHF